MTRQNILSNDFALARDLHPRLVDIDSLKPLGAETRRHPPAQIRKLVSSIQQFGFVLPIVIDANKHVVAGLGLVLAARQAGLRQVPAIVIDDLDDADLRLLRLALNRLSEDSSWDDAALSLEFEAILAIDSNIDLQISGFEMGEIDVAISAGRDDEEDPLPALSRELGLRGEVSRTRFLR
jgi:ParB-like chromosome segregation protein Spo0J